MSIAQRGRQWGTAKVGGPTGVKVPKQERFVGTSHTNMHREFFFKIIYSFKSL